MGLERQIRLLSVYGLFTYPFACVPFLFFFFKEHGIDLEQYLWMIALYYWAMVVMEVPTGLIADRFGRKLSMVAGSAMLAVGFVVVHGGTTFRTFATGEVLLGVGHSLLSGAPTAMLFDSLREHRDEGEFLHLESRIQAMRLLGTGGSFLLGGLLAAVAGIQSTILLTVLFCAVGAVLAAALHETPRAAGARPRILQVAVRDIRSGPLVWILVYFVLLFGLLRFAFHTYQPYFEETVFDPGNPERNWLVLGFLFAALNVLAARCSRLAPRLSARFRLRAIFPWLPVALCLSFLVMGLLPSWLGIAMFFVHQVPFGMHWSLIQEFVNKRIDSAARATVLSMLSFAGRISFAAWIPLAGAYEEAHGTPRTYAWIGAIGLVLTVAWCAPRLAARLLPK